jgi:glycosyltransferase involved in cell wall biosynthesis
VNYDGVGEWCNGAPGCGEVASELPIELTLGGRPLATSGVTAPTVGVIVVNHNYSAYVGGTIDSLRSQTYPWFECIIVDNGSTDESVKVARRHVGDDPRFRFILLERNLGHIGGGLAGLAEIRNEFVVFVDADDSLLPDFLASHVQAHLASGFGVGLTSSNVIETDAAGMALTGTRPGFRRRSVASPRERASGERALRRCFSGTEKRLTLSAQQRARLALGARHCEHVQKEPA